MNYSGKIIGLEVTKGGLSGMVPCFPSAPILDSAPYKWVDTFQGTSYEKTKQLLSKVSKDSKGEVPSLPAVKVLEWSDCRVLPKQTNSFLSICSRYVGNDLKSVSNLVTSIQTRPQQTKLLMKRD